MKTSKLLFPLLLFQFVSCGEAVPKYEDYENTKKAHFCAFFYAILNYLLIINAAAPIMPALYPSVAETRSTTGEFVYP